MWFWKKIFFIALFLTVTFFIVDVGRYFIYPHVAYLKKHNPGETAFMKYREETLAEKKS